jgi:hypothetical protein
MSAIKAQWSQSTREASAPPYCKRVPPTGASIRVEPGQTHASTLYSDFSKTSHDPLMPISLA